MSKMIAPARSIRRRDVIEVEVENCEVLKVTPVPGQLKARGPRLLEITVVPVSGPWANCEGKFIVESTDDLTVVRKFTKKQQRRESFRAFIQQIKEKILGPRIEEVTPAKQVEHKAAAPWT